MYIPTHISKEAQQFLKDFPSFEEREPLLPEDLEGWTAFRNELHPIWESFKELLNFEYKLSDTIIEGVPCVWMETPKTNDNSKVLFYIHSGSYCLGEPKVNASLPLQIAHASGIKVLAVNYRKAPENPFPAGLDDVVNAYSGLLNVGYDSKSIGWFGDSAGGALVAAGMLHLREKQIPYPAVAGLISPMADLTGTGDTFQTLAKKDPIMYNWDACIESVWAYCGSQNPENPQISPVYGDFTGFPPMLIQVGSKEILLSDAIRLYRNAKNADIPAVLDVWEGMWHVFQALPHIPEAQKACQEMADFLTKHLQ